MKKIYLNLKRFDVPAASGGINRLAPIESWAREIINRTQDALARYDGQAEFTMFFPEAHLLLAKAASNGRIHIGSQGVFRADIGAGGNFGAFTTNLPATAARELGADTALIGHSEERNDKIGAYMLGGGDRGAVNAQLNMEVKAALKAGLKVLYCIGEREDEMECWENVLRIQLNIGLMDVDPKRVTIAYEPIWAIGPGKTPPDKAYIQKIARYVNDHTGGVEMVYGGGLKKENAGMLAQIPEISGGLIALTNFGENFGFTPEGYLEIVETYLQQGKEEKNEA